jgi:MoaA/NifB/PqqE/SkfB family radical SAM enzyme
MTSTADIKVGYLCNNHCLHCAIGDFKRELEENNVATDLTTQQVFQLLENQACTADNCVLTGGEITLRKDCAQLI